MGSKQPFADVVYAYVATIPRGQVRTYAQVARAIGRPQAVRAVGNVLGKNTRADVPCHRVVRSDGTPGGYRDGTQAKMHKLRSEGVVLY